MINKVTFFDLFQKLAQINRLAEPLGLEFFVILDSYSFVFCLTSTSHCLFRTSDVNLFYSKMCDFYSIGLRTVVSASFDKNSSDI